MEGSDRELLYRYRRGNVEALEVLVGRYRRQLFAVIMNMTQQQHEAEEVYQEVWLRVVRKQAKYRHGNFCGWLIRIARNVFIDRARRRKPDASLDAEYAEGLPLVQMIPGSEPAPSEKMAARDLGVKMRQAVKTLPPDQREVFVMRVQADLSFREIARAQKVSINTALARMQYALVKLRAILGKEYEEMNRRI